MAQLKQKKKKKESGFLTYWRCSYKHTYPHIHPHICSPLQPEKPQPKLLLLPAAGLTVCPSFLMNGHWLPKGTLLLGSAAPSPSLSYPCHHILTISLFSSSIMLHSSSFLPLSSFFSPPSLSLVVVIPLPPPFTLSACSFVFISLIYFLCQMQADSHQSLSHTHARADAHTPDLATRRQTRLRVRTDAHSSVLAFYSFTVFIAHTHPHTHARTGWITSHCSEVSSAVTYPLFYPCPPPPPTPKTLPINITEDGCVFIAEIDCGYRVMVPFMCVRACVCV